MTDYGKNSGQIAFAVQASLGSVISPNANNTSTPPFYWVGEPIYGAKLSVKRKRIQRSILGKRKPGTLYASTIESTLPVDWEFRDCYFLKKLLGTASGTPDTLTIADADPYDLFTGYISMSGGTSAGDIVDVFQDSRIRSWMLSCAKETEDAMFPAKVNTEFILGKRTGGKTLITSGLSAHPNTKDVQYFLDSNSTLSWNSKSFKDAVTTFSLRITSGITHQHYNKLTDGKESIPSRGRIKIGGAFSVEPDSADDLAMIDDFYSGTKRTLTFELKYSASYKYNFSITNCLIVDPADFGLPNESAIGEVIFGFEAEDISVACTDDIDYTA